MSVVESIKCFITYLAFSFSKCRSLMINVVTFSCLSCSVTRILDSQAFHSTTTTTEFTRIKFSFLKKNNKKKKIFFFKWSSVAVAPCQLQRGSCTVAPWHRGTVAVGQRGSGAPWHRDTVQRSTVAKSKNSSFYKDKITNIQRLIPFDFMLIMIIGIDIDIIEYNYNYNNIISIELYCALLDWYRWYTYYNWFNFDDNYFQDWKCDKIDPDTNDLCSKFEQIENSIKLENENHL